MDIMRLLPSVKRSLFFDRLTIAPSDADSLTCDNPVIPCDSSNLIQRAVTCYREKTGWDLPLAIHLEKRIPIEAGLGGGSSNAATTLWALNQLNPSPVPTPSLIEWAGTFSSDAPFFFSTGAAYCEGRGEKVTPVSPLPSRSFWIAKPKGGLSTPAVYAAHRVTQTKHIPFTGEFSLQNDLEEAAFSLLPSLSSLKAQLLEIGFTDVVMTGSGTAFLCFGEVSHPQLPDVQFFPVSFTYREDPSWYG